MLSAIAYDNDDDRSMILQYKTLEKICVFTTASLRDVSTQINDNIVQTEGVAVALVIDRDMVLQGVISDGDIRRALANGVSAETSAAKIMNKNYVFLNDRYSHHEALRKFDRSVRFIPVIDNSRRLVDVVFYSSLKDAYRKHGQVIRARAPVRLSFAGGGFDFSDLIDYQETAVICATLSKYCYASITPRNDGKIIVTSRDLGQTFEAENLNQLECDGNLEIIKSAIRVVNPSSGFNLETNSEIPIGSGLGASSAMVVAVIAAMMRYENTTDLDTFRVADLAFQAERIDFGNTGGWQDHYAATFGGFNWIE